MSETRQTRQGGRIASMRAQDNGWWWQAVDDGRLPIQRCKDCSTLRHPPRPMCGACQSLAWDSIDSAMAGEVVTFTVLHYPAFPGYPSPNVCAVIRLDEGVNFVSNVVGCDPAAVRIGMRVQGRVEDVEEAMRLPQFYPANDD